MTLTCGLRTNATSNNKALDASCGRPRRIPTLLYSTNPHGKVWRCLAAVCPADGRMAVAQAHTFCAETFLGFLKQLFGRRKRGRKMVVILDNARWHHARVLQPWIKEHKKYLRLDFLPPYSPELNCIERVWKLIRRLRTHNRYFPRMEDFVKAVFEQFQSWQKPNRVLQHLCAIT